MPDLLRYATILQSFLDAAIPQYNLIYSFYLNSLCEANKKKKLNYLLVLKGKNSCGVDPKPSGQSDLLSPNG
jgi:hypothetical protein